MQPWGGGRYGLGPQLLAPVLKELAERGWTDEEFVSVLMAQGKTISRDRTNILGLLISLVKNLCPPRAYPADRAPSDRLTPAGDIVRNLVPSGGNGDPPESA